jgi:NADPH:quinone reductase-like Zn-dependent oxidoreductase
MGSPARPAVPGDRQRRRRRRAARRRGCPQLEAGRSCHGPLQLRRRSGPDVTRRFDDGQQPAIWGYETNFGGLADLAVVKVNQLLPKPAHLTWEEAAVNALCNSTSYRMLVSRNGAAMKQGDVVLIWGATGGIGAYAAQYVLNGGGIPVCVVSSPDKARSSTRWESTR